MTSWFPRSQATTLSAGGVVFDFPVQCQLVLQGYLSSAGANLRVTILKYILIWAFGKTTGRRGIAMLQG